MKHKYKAALLAFLVGVLAACSDPGPQAHENSYWDNNPKEALARLEQCEAKGPAVRQELNTTPPEELSVLARECMYLMGRFDKNAARKALGLEPNGWGSLLDD